MQTRIRLADTQSVTAIAELSDGSFLERVCARRRHACRVPGGAAQFMSARISMPSAAKRGEVIEIRAELHPAISANPYVAFSTVATESGTLEFRWTGDDGFALAEKATLQVS